MTSIRFTRRCLLTGAASFASMPLLKRSSSALAKSPPELETWIGHRLLMLAERYERFIAADAADISCAEDLLNWQILYDDLVGAADVLRFAITDDTPGGGKAIETARIHVMPPCERAIMYGRPIETSRSFGSVVSQYFALRDAFILSIAVQTPRNDPAELARHGTAALREVLDTMPVTRGDRIALRRVIESINNNDMVDVAMVRSVLEPHEIKDFLSWAEPCGSFTCERCEAWLGKHEAFS